MSATRAAAAKGHRAAKAGATTLFAGFARRRIRTSGATINLVCAGRGEPVLLLHGYPQTHAMWHKVAPVLARSYAVVCPDLRGYGDSSKPRGLPDHSNYSKRAMARDMAEVMDALGHRRFHVVGHDRGGRVAHRLARDHARRVHTLTVLDISPTLKVFESTDMALAKAYYHWFLMLQPPPLPEQMLAGRVPLYILGRVGRARPDLSKFSREAVREYVRCFSNPRAIHASCEDYRAAGTIDLDHDRRDRAKKLAMPVLALWGKQAVVERLFDCLEDWREVAQNVTGRALDCGHFIPEEAPEQTIAQIARFLRRHPMKERA
jgi:haloacetate dehalogenase